MEDFYFAKGSKNFEECGISERFAIISILKEELNPISKSKWFKINSFRNQAHLFALRLKAYLFNNPGVVYQW